MAAAQASEEAPRDHNSQRLVPAVTSIPITVESAAKERGRNSENVWSASHVEDQRARRIQRVCLISWGASSGNSEPFDVTAAPIDSELHGYLVFFATRRKYLKRRYEKMLGPRNI